MNIFFLLLLLLSAPFSFGQSALSKNDEQMIWLLREVIPKELAVSRELSHDTFLKLETYFANRANDPAAGPAEFKLDFYLQRDLGPGGKYEGTLSPEIRTYAQRIIKMTFEAYKNKSPQDFAKGLWGIKQLSAHTKQGKTPSTATALNRIGPPAQAPVTPAPPSIKTTVIQEATPPVQVVRPSPPTVNTTPQKLSHLRAPSIDCRKLAMTPAQQACMKNHPLFTKNRIVVDAGHYGGTLPDGNFVKDSRRMSNGYQEGYGTFVAAQLTKAILVNCFGASEQNIPVTRNDLFSVGDKRLATVDGQPVETLDDKNYRSNYIASLSPDLFISLHTNAGSTTSQRIEVFTVREPTDPKGYSKTPEAFRRSNDFAEKMKAGLEASFFRHDGIHNRKDLMGFNQATQIKQTDWDVFRAMLRSPAGSVSQAPMILVEGFFHDRVSSDLVHAQKNKTPQTESLQVNNTSYPYHSAFRWYAEGVATGIAAHYGCWKTPTATDSGSQH